MFVRVLNTPLLSILLDTGSIQTFIKQYKSCIRSVYDVCFPEYLILNIKTGTRFQMRHEILPVGNYIFKINNRNTRTKV